MGFVLFFLVCKKIAFSVFPQQPIILLGGGGKGVVLYSLYSSLFFVGFCFMFVIFSLGEGLRLVALFDSRPSRFT